VFFGWWFWGYAQQLKAEGQKGGASAVETLSHKTKIRLEKNNTSQKKPLLKNRLKILAGNKRLIGTWVSHASALT
jgi:hypothetical protein